MAEAAGRLCINKSACAFFAGLGTDWCEQKEERMRIVVKVSFVRASVKEYNESFLNLNLFTNAGKGIQ